MNPDRNRTETERRGRFSAGREFAVRLGSAMVLAGAAIALTWAGGWPFAALVAGCAIVAALEWADIIGAPARGAETALNAVVLIAASALAALKLPLAALAVLAAGVAVALLSPRRERLAFGILYIGLPAVALIAIRGDAGYGLRAVLFLLLVVWCADSMAYVFGRLIGGARLAPAISPGKTWAGAVAGVVVPAGLAALCAPWAGDTSAAMLALVAGGLAIAAQAGDLAESAIKRVAGIKDTGKLIPGHGGALDRLDGVLFAAAAAGLLALLRAPESPGRALLIWP